MSLDKTPPSRYRIEEKDGRLIVHDSLSSKVLGNQFSSTAPEARSRSSLDAVGSTPSSQQQTSYEAPAARSRSALDAVGSTPSPGRQTGFQAAPDQERIKRGAFVGIGAVLLALFLIFTMTWPIIIMAIVAPLRQAVISKLLPALKLYINEGRWS